MSHHLPPTISSLLYFYHVRRIFEYASPLWHGAISAELALSLEKLQVDVLKGVLDQIPPLTFDLWPLPYKEMITWYVYILPEMTSYVYSSHEILPPRVHHVYITCTSREHRMYMIAPAKTRSKVTWERNIRSLPYRCKCKMNAPPAKTGVFITSVFTIFPDMSEQVEQCPSKRCTVARV